MYTHKPPYSVCECMCNADKSLDFNDYWAEIEIRNSLLITKAIKRIILLIPTQPGTDLSNEHRLV